MTLVDRLEAQARDLDWKVKGSFFNRDLGYAQRERDMCDLLLEAAKRIRELEKWEMVVPPRPYKRGIKGVDRGYRNFW